MALPTSHCSLCAAAAAAPCSCAHPQGSAPSRKCPAVEALYPPRSHVPICSEAISSYVQSDVQGTSLVCTATVLHDVVCMQALHPSHYSNSPSTLSNPAHAKDDLTWCWGTAGGPLVHLPAGLVGVNLALLGTQLSPQPAIGASLGPDRATGHLPHADGPVPCRHLGDIANWQSFDKPPHYISLTLISQAAAGVYSENRSR
jgi:hypothetical protein